MSDNVTKLSYKDTAAHLSSIVVHGDRQPVRAHKSIQRQRTQPEQDSTPGRPTIFAEIIRVASTFCSIIICLALLCFGHNVLMKFWSRIVNDPTNNDLIRWSDNGDSFFGAYRFLPPSYTSPNPLSFSLRLQY